MGTAQVILFKQGSSRSRGNFHRLLRDGGITDVSAIKCCEMIALATKLGSPAHHSLLLRKARQVGLHSAPELIGLAIARGCLHYQGGPEPVPSTLPSRGAFSDEELAVALLSPSLPYSPRALRVGAQMLGSRHNQPRQLALLARQERAENVMRHIAIAGQQTEPHETFWTELLAALPSASLSRSALPAGVLPHPSRFRIETGFAVPSSFTASGGSQVRWLRPAPASGTLA